MVEPAVILAGTAVVGLSPSAAVVGLRYRAGQQWSRSLESYRLGLPADLDYRSVETFLAGLAGLLPSRWLRPVTIRGVILEVSADESGITHRLLATATGRDSVLAGLRANLPGISLTPEPDYRPAEPTLAGELVSTNSRHQLQVDRPEAVASAILSALFPLEADETLTVQYVLLPQGHVRPPQPPQIAPAGGRLQTTIVPKAIREKFAKALFAVAIRIGVTSPNPDRDRQLLRRLNAAFAAASSEHARLRRRWQTSRSTALAMRTHLVPALDLPGRLNSAELVGLLAWPAAGTSQPGMHLAGTRQLPPSTEIARSGRIVAVSTYPGIPERPLALTVGDSLTHTYVIGPTGVGKSTLLLGLITQDLAAGQGVVVVDPKGDLVADVLERIPAGREDDVVILDPTDDEMPVGLNLLAGGSEAPELVAEQVLTTFHKIYATSWGPRTDDVLRAALLSLVSVPGMTLAEVPLLLTDPNFRRSIVSRLDDPVGLGPFFSWYEALGASERTQVIGPILNKMRAVLMRPRLRRVLGQAEPLLDFDDVLATAKILLVPLPKGTLGDDASSLIGSVLIARLWQAVQRRTRLPHNQRPAVFAYIDEFQDFLGLPVPIPDVLAQARGLGLGLTLAHQNLGQLGPEIREAVLANCRSQVFFQTSASDASRLSREVAPYLNAADLQGLGAYEIVARLAAQGHIAPPVTGRTRPAPPPTSQADEIRQRSRKRYGRPVAEVDDELRQRHAQVPESGPIGRQRRAS